MIQYCRQTMSVLALARYIASKTNISISTKRRRVLKHPIAAQSQAFRLLSVHCTAALIYFSASASVFFSPRLCKLIGSLAKYFVLFDLFLLSALRMSAKN